LTYNGLRYILCVIIQSFQCAETHALFIRRKHRKWSSIQSVALRKLDQLNAAAALSDLAIPPGNRLELLKGSRKGQHSIRINDQWRICFLWTAHGAHNVEIVDYH
jgi:proteic killer suppression protein